MAFEASAALTGGGLPAENFLHQAPFSVEEVHAHRRLDEALDACLREDLAAEWSLERPYEDMVDYAVLSGLDKDKWLSEFPLQGMGHVKQYTALVVLNYAAAGAPMQIFNFFGKATTMTSTDFASWLEIQEELGGFMTYFQAFWNPAITLGL